MIAKKVQAAFNEQIREEFGSAYIYLSMAAWFRNQNLHGMEQWMKVQATEEVKHGMKFFDFINERGGRVELAALPQPKAKWGSALEAFRDACKHEQYITGRINLLLDLCRKEGDTAGDNFLQWFVDEQVEEEANPAKIVATLERIGDSGAGLIMLDHELGKRE